MNNMLNILLMASPQGGQGGGSPMVSLLFFAGMIVVMWLFMIRPQTKKAKLQKQFGEGLREGDKIVTIAGIHGKIKKINDNNTIQMEVSPGTFFTIERSAVSMEYTTAHNKPAEEKK
ncbi:preprotein translocase subunit YajC [Chitinophaga rupis]|uniref:Sec translocon accessory complex subunit YajC n=2 Tax=Chitinophaga TaxID=79328 RepID=A0A1H7XUC0_9BACT|nr:preprotein translocase subunit YajC [Chitinophaga rupis]SEM37233.1 preprotein translocase subunit YajC [Chitinophaga rupis]